MQGYLTPACLIFLPPLSLPALATLPTVHFRCPALRVSALALSIAGSFGTQLGLPNPVPSGLKYCRTLCFDRALFYFHHTTHPHLKLSWPGWVLVFAWLPSPLGCTLHTAGLRDLSCLTHCFISCPTLAHNRASINTVCAQSICKRGSPPSLRWPGASDLSRVTQKVSGRVGPEFWASWASAPPWQ